MKVTFEGSANDIAQFIAGCLDVIPLAYPCSCSGGSGKDIHDRAQANDNLFDGWEKGETKPKQPSAPYSPMGNIEVK